MHDTTPTQPRASGRLQYESFCNTPPGRYRRPCPQCNRGKRDTALSIRVEADGRALYLCHRCGMRGASGDRQQRAAHPPARQHLGLSDYAKDLWRSAQPFHGVAEAYLRARRCLTPPSDGDLRCAELRHPSGYVGTALVALITDAITGQPLSLHRTWVRADGSKAPVSPPRLLLKGHAKKGGVVRLWPDEAVTTGLAIAEGIETALCAAHGYTPVWAAVDASNLTDLPTLDGIEAVTVFADRDPAGMKAARTLGERWARAHREVRIVTAEQDGHDIADMVVA